MRPGPPQTKKEDEKRCHFHWNRLIEDINPARRAVQHFLDIEANRLDALVPGDAGRAVVQLLANLMQREALVMTYNDAIMVVGCLFVAGLFLMPLVAAGASQGRPVTESQAASELLWRTLRQKGPVEQNALINQNLTEFA